MQERGSTRRPKYFGLEPPVHTHRSLLQVRRQKHEISYAATDVSSYSTCTDPVQAAE